MNIKKLLRFYFFAGSLDRALNDKIFRLAIAAGTDTYSGCVYYAERIADVIGVKGQLGRLWVRLDGVIGAMTDKDRATLMRYAVMRRGACKEEQRELHRAVVKFTRRAGGLLSGGNKLYKIMCAYGCLLNPEPD